MSQRARSAETRPAYQVIRPAPSCGIAGIVYLAALAATIAMYLYRVSRILADWRYPSLSIGELVLHTILAGMVAHALWTTWRWQRQPGRWARRNLVMCPQTSTDAILLVALYSFLWRIEATSGGGPSLQTAAFVAVVVIMFVRGIQGYRSWRRSWRLLEEHVVCAECGYILTDLESSRCPECGSRLGPQREITLGRLHGRIRHPT